MRRRHLRFRTSVVAFRLHGLDPLSEILILLAKLDDHFDGPADSLLETFQGVGLFFLPRYRHGHAFSRAALARSTNWRKHDSSVAAISANTLRFRSTPPTNRASAR